MSDHVAALAIYILACCPALFEEPAALTLASILLAVLDVLGHGLPLVLVPARTGQISSFALLSLPNFVCVSHCEPAGPRRGVFVTSLAGGVGGTPTATRERWREEAWL